ncbi:precorrin-2 C(20)-methyltransferase [Janibacter cremeus]|uniref:Precorrin-2 C20-methyltransferase/precorrin-3B C17-methyltransferase n=1 Tax=Janibacter cremeus TaxID=1285192 RepID=A0A852VNU1_9MICO|nr:precorrin-2 C(20)-methyltransferase [Janibacter cremeus]NYF97130.1 precorrin-2 C20-methyltransferase/precorrin-3B C17-methyltransferase [Janibacter cremeus]
MSGRFYGVGIGPGDPELITLKAARLIAEADVIAYHAGAGKQSMARSIAAGLIPEGVVEEELRYPVTTGTTNHPGGYYGALADFYDECSQRLESHLAAGRTVVVLAVGDPLFFGSFMYVHDRLSPHYPTQVVPGITSLSAATAAVATGLCRHEDTLTVLPGTLAVPELARRLADTDAAIIMKLGRTFAGVREALRRAGLLERAVYVERASGTGQVVLPAAEVDEGRVPYMSLVVVPGEGLRDDAAGRAADFVRMTAGAEGATGAGEVLPPFEAPTRHVGPTSSHLRTPPSSSSGTVHVVGLGPGPDRWLTPEASDVLGSVAHVVGYGPYLARVPQREGLTRHASGNSVELDRGRLALDLAKGGEDVALVSGGDAGVFGMATALFESRDAALTEDRGYADVPVKVVPGVTAAHAASALVGAVLGGDHALVNLSDNLKPWDVLADRLIALATHDIAIALYNPRSRSRPDTLGAARDLLVDAVGPGRVVVVARHVGRDQESVSVSTLGELDVEAVDMGCLVVIGASSTRVTDDGRVWTPRSVG